MLCVQNCVPGSLAPGQRPLWDLHQHGGTRYEGSVLPVLEAGGMLVWLDMQVSARPIHANHSGKRKRRRSIITEPKYAEISLPSFYFPYTKMLRQKTRVKKTTTTKARL